MCAVSVCSLQDNEVTEGPHNCFLGGGNEADQNTSVAGVDCVRELFGLS